MKYDYIIIGAGLTSGVLARELAEKQNKKILIIERRNHTAGNMYDYDNTAGIKVQKYGPHVLHTDNERVYQYITQYCEPVPYKTKCEAVIQGVSTPSPFNFKTIDQFYEKDSAEQLKQKLLDYYKNREEVTVVELLQAEDKEIRGYAEFLFEEDYRPYTAKQWNLSPEKIDPSVLNRVPVVLSYRDTYFRDRYEFMPRSGFKTLYNRMTNHKNIEICLGVDGLDHILLDEQGERVLYDGDEVNIIYTGAIDELFNYKFGMLPYRSLEFKFCTEKRESFQNVAIVAYPKAIGYTRITEYTKMPVQNGKCRTSIAYEYPVAYNKGASVGKEPYYPVLTEQSQIAYENYRVYASKFKNLTLCGRLADFKYYNMDQVILRALEVYDALKEK